MLLQVISRQTNAVIKGLLLRHAWVTSAPKKKADLAKMLLTHVLEDPETRYRTLLADFTKRAIDEVLPVRAARKADAMDVMMRVDRLTFPRPADRDPSIAMQLVLVDRDPSIAMQLVLDVGAQQKKMKRTWVRMARRKLKSQQTITALKKLMSGPDADRMSVDDLCVEVSKVVGVDINPYTPNMYVFFHKHVQRLLRKKADQSKPRRKRRSQRLAFVDDAVAVKAWGETQAMWAEDHWPWKFAMLDAQRGRS